MRECPRLYGGRARYPVQWQKQPETVLDVLPRQEHSDAENSAPDASHEAGTGGDAA